MTTPNGAPDQLPAATLQVRPRTVNGTCAVARVSYCPHFASLSLTLTRSGSFHPSISLSLSLVAFTESGILKGFKTAARVVVDQHFEKVQKDLFFGMFVALRLGLPSSFCFTLLPSLTLYHSLSLSPSFWIYKIKNWRKRTPKRMRRSIVWNRNCSRSKSCMVCLLWLLLPSFCFTVVHSLTLPLSVCLVAFRQSGCENWSFEGRHCRTQTGREKGLGRNDEVKEWVEGPAQCEDWGDGRW